MFLQQNAGASTLSREEFKREFDNMTLSRIQRQALMDIIDPWRPKARRQ